MNTHNAELLDALNALARAIRDARTDDDVAECRDILATIENEAWGLTPEVEQALLDATDDLERLEARFEDD